ncbi:Fungal specific transcription factor domain-containing protein isoform 2 [Cladophialophora immunda]|nr:Fungal specific transcription factor domain-containing protein isoform 2 [Cladophialophora immunda]
MDSLSRQDYYDNIRRKRSLVACKLCRERKVRCNVAQSGIPCHNCVETLAECTIPARKSRRKRHTPVHSPAIPLDSSPSVEVSNDPKSPPPFPGPSFPAHKASFPASESTVFKEVDNVIHRIRTPSIDRSVDTCHSNLDLASSSLGTDHLTNIYRSSSVESPSTRSAGSSANKVSEANRNFLRAKGALDFPPTDICDRLLRTYFHQVHPFLPIVQPNDFLMQYEAGGPCSTDLVLLWSMFLAAANFLDVETLTMLGYSSRKMAKRAVYQKAKACFHTCTGQSRTVHIQSALLMGLWISDLEGDTTAWHWTGVAIALYQCARVACRTDSHSNRGAGSFPSENRLMPLIWWNCCIRDAWLSLALGRSMRAAWRENFALPSVTDMSDYMTGMPDALKIKYLPGDLTVLHDLWVDLLKTSLVLKRILAIRDQFMSVPVPQDKFSGMESELLCVSRSCEEKLYGRSGIVLAHGYQLEFYVWTVTSVLYHLRGSLKAQWSNSQTGRDPSISPSEMRSLLFRCSTALDKLIVEDAIRTSPPMLIFALCPVIQLQLMNSIHPNSLAQQAAIHHLELYMLVVQELQHTYWSADFLFDVCSHAMKQPQIATKRDHPARTMTVPAKPPPGSNLAVEGRTSGYLDSSPVEFLPDVLSCESDRLRDSRVSLDAYNIKTSAFIRTGEVEQGSESTKPVSPLVPLEWSIFDDLGVNWSLGGAEEYNTAAFS